MPEAVEKAEQASLLPDEVSSAQRSAGPVESPPALFDTGPILRASDEAPVARPERGGSQPSQLPLPLYETLEPEPEPLVRAKEKPQRRSGKKGFVPVTRDPDVARSYSDNVALDYAIARGLAQALTSLPPEELAALRAKVARTLRQSGKISHKPR